MHKPHRNDTGSDSNGRQTEDQIKKRMYTGEDHQMVELNKH